VNSFRELLLIEFSFYDVSYWRIHTNFTHDQKD
jgi:hypothetical protein